MTDEQMAALRAAAEKATPGPWNTNGYNENEVDANDGRIVAICFGPESHTEPAALANAAYIALANPAAVLALLDRVAAAEAQLERADTAINILHRAMIGPGKVPPRFKRPINEARAALAAAQQETQR